MQTSFDILILIGRFQPFHNGHLAVVRYALTQAKCVVLLAGSARMPRSIRNPWTEQAVEQMVHGSLDSEAADRVEIIPLVDELYNEERWVGAVQLALKEVSAKRFGDAAVTIGLIGLGRDGESYYPKRFPQWKALPFTEDNGIRGTTVRESLFGMRTNQSGGADYLESAQAGIDLPEPVRRQLRQYCDSSAYATIKEEAAFIAKYRRAWENAPYPPTFVTVDAVVVQSGHILLVERKAQPGKGLWALPGGFLRGDETLEAACLRELRDETRLKVPTPVLKGSIRQRRVFDAPHRSQRGRTITHAFYFELEPNTQLPKARGGDDARHAFWLPLAELEPEKLFEDHYFIIRALIG